MSLEFRRPAIVFWSVVASLLVVDQAVKAYMRSVFVPGQSVPVVDGVFHLTLVRNAGAAFGLLPGQRFFFILTSLVVLVAIALYWYRVRPTERLLVLGVAGVCGGALGNLFDRLVFGRVTDLFDFTLIDFPVFNVADSGIFIGVVLLVVWVLFVPERSDSEPDE